MAETFLVKFRDVGRKKLSWEERIARPIDEQAIVTAVKRRKALLSRGISAPYVDDYGGFIYAGERAVGYYAIVPNV